MTSSIVSPPRPAAVAAVLAKASSWTHGRRKSDGRELWFIPGSRPGVVYMADARNCTCPDANERQRRCKHSLAVEQFQARRQPAPKPVSAYQRLYPLCDVPGCREDALRSGKCLDHRALAVAS